MDYKGEQFSACLGKEKRSFPFLHLISWLLSLEQILIVIKPTTGTFKTRKS